MAWFALKQHGRLLSRRKREVAAWPAQLDAVVEDLNYAGVRLWQSPAAAWRSANVLRLVPRGTAALRNQEEGCAPAWPGPSQDTAHKAKAWPGARLASAGNQRELRSGSARDDCGALICSIGKACAVGRAGDQTPGQRPGVPAANACTDRFIPRSGRSRGL
jgi:hypothetical protein